MKLVLTHDVPKLGVTNDIVSVKAGFGRNFLLPRGLARMLTPRLQKALELEHAREEAKRAKLFSQATELLRTLDGLVLQFRRKAAKTGKLYGSISRATIAKVLKAEHAIDLPTSSITLAAPIRELGTTKANIHLGEGLDAKLTIRVAAEK